MEGSYQQHGTWMNYWRNRRILKKMIYSNGASESVGPNEVGDLLGEGLNLAVVCST